MRVGELSCLNRFRSSGASVNAEEAVTVRVIRVDRCVDRENGVMLAALAILCLVIDRGTVDLNFSGAVVALEVRHVIHRVPQAEFHIREEGYAARGSVLVGHADLQDLTVVADRDKCSDLGRDLILFSVEDGVTDSVTGLIIVERCLGRLPSRIPDRIAVLNIEVMAVAVLRRVVVAESCKTEKLGVFIEAVPAAGVRSGVFGVVITYSLFWSSK